MSRLLPFFPQKQTTQLVKWSRYAAPYAKWGGELPTKRAHKQERCCLPANPTFLVPFLISGTHSDPEGCPLIRLWSDGRKEPAWKKIGWWIQSAGRKVVGWGSAEHQQTMLPFRCWRRLIVGAHSEGEIGGHQDTKPLSGHAHVVELPLPWGPSGSVNFFDFSEICEDGAF